MKEYVNKRNIVITRQGFDIFTKSQMIHPMFL